MFNLVKKVLEWSGAAGCVVISADFNVDLFSSNSTHKRRSKLFRDFLRDNKFCIVSPHSKSDFTRRRGSSKSLLDYVVTRSLHSWLFTS